MLSQWYDEPLCGRQLSYISEGAFPGETFADAVSIKEKSDKKTKYGRKQEEFQGPITANSKF